MCLLSFCDQVRVSALQKLADQLPHLLEDDWGGRGERKASGGTDSGKEEATAGIRGWKPKGPCAVGTRGANDRKPLGRSGRLSVQLKHSLLFLIPVLPSLKHSLYILNSEEGLDKKRGCSIPGVSACQNKSFARARTGKGQGPWNGSPAVPRVQGTSPLNQRQGILLRLPAPLPLPKQAGPFSFPRSWIEKQVWPIAAGLHQ